jgi:hypothetical protein
MVRNKVSFGSRVQLWESNKVNSTGNGDHIIRY